MTRFKLQLSNFNKFTHVFIIYIFIPTEDQHPHAIKEVDHTGPIVGAIVTGVVAIIGMVVYCYCSHKK